MTKKKVVRAYFLVDCKCNMHFCEKSEEHPYGFYSTFTRRVYQAVPDQDFTVINLTSYHRNEVLELDLSSGIIPLGMHDLSNITGVVAKVICENDPSELIPDIQRRIDGYFEAKDRQ